MLGSGNSEAKLGSLSLVLVLSRERKRFIPSLKGMPWQQLQPGASMLGDETASVLDS